jgi:serine/threonine protein kinase
MEADLHAIVMFSSIIEEIRTYRIM